MQELLENLLHYVDVNPPATAEDARGDLKGIVGRLLEKGNIFTRAEAFEFFIHIMGTIMARANPVENGRSKCYYISIDDVDYDLMTTGELTSIRIMRGPDTMPSIMNFHDGELYFRYRKHHKVTYHENGMCEFRIGTIHGTFNERGTYIIVFFNAEHHGEERGVEMKIMDCGYLEVHFYGPVANGEWILLNSPLPGLMGAGV